MPHGVEDFKKLFGELIGREFGGVGKIITKNERGQEVTIRYLHPGYYKNDEKIEELEAEKVFQKEYLIL